MVAATKTPHPRPLSKGEGRNPGPRSGMAAMFNGKADKHAVENHRKPGLLNISAVSRPDAGSRAFEITAAASTDYFVAS